jgi:hypothetical protein
MTDCIHHVLTLACRGLISMVIVLLNFVLKAVLHRLVEFEKHWTQSDKVRQGVVVAVPEL